MYPRHSKPTLFALLLLGLSCGSASTDEAAQGSTRPGDKCPCAAGLTCVFDGCWRPCPGVSGDCGRGNRCHQGACIVVNAFPLPDGERVLPKIVGEYTSFDVDGDWAYFYGRSGSTKNDYGIWATKLFGDGQLSLVVSRLRWLQTDRGRTGFLARRGWLYWVDDSRLYRASPPDFRPVEIGPADVLVPSPSRDLIVYARYNGDREASATIYVIDAATAAVLSQIPTHAEGLTATSVASSTRVFFPSAPSTLPPLGELQWADLATGSVGGTATPMPFSYRFPDVRSLFGAGTFLVNHHVNEQTMYLRDTAVAGMQERAFYSAARHTPAVTDAAVYLPKASSRGIDLKRIAVPDGSESTIGWLTASGDEPAFRPVTVVSPPWVYVATLDYTLYFRPGLYRYPL